MSKINMRPYVYGMGQHMYFNPMDRKLNQGKRYYWNLIRNKNNFRVGRFTEGTLLESCSYRDKFKNSYRYYPEFWPGQEIFIIVSEGRRGAKIVKDVIEETMCYGRGKGYRKDYWLKRHGNGHGVDANDIFKTYNEARAALFYIGG